MIKFAHPPTSSLSLKETFQRYRGFILTIAIGLAICISLFVLSLKVRMIDTENSFKATARLKQVFLEQSLQQEMNRYGAIQAFLQSSQITRITFQELSQPLFQFDFESLHWIPQQAQGDSLPFISIFSNNFRPHFPIDLKRSPGLLNQLFRLANAKKTVFIKLSSLDPSIQEEKILVVGPVLRTPGNPNGAGLRGYLLGSISVTDLFKRLKENDGPDPILDTHLFISSVDGTFERISKKPHSVKAGGARAPEFESNGLPTYSFDVNLLDSSWRFILTPHRSDFLSSEYMGPWAVLIMGLIILVLLATFLLYLIQGKERIEAAATEALKNTRHEISRLVAIVASSSDAITGKTLDGIFTDWNPGAQRLYGYSAEEILGTSIERLVPIGRKNEMPKILERIQRDERIKSYETVRRRKDGSEVSVSMTISPIKDQRGRIIGASSISRDISEIVAARLALQSKATELARSNEELERFAYIASHDLQEPLRTVSSFGGLLKDEYREFLPGNAQQYIDFMIEATERMQQLIKGLLEYSRVEKQKLRLAEVNLNDCLLVAKQNLLSTIHRVKATIMVDFLPTIVADKGQMIRLFQNLISNALKFRKPDLDPFIRINAERFFNSWRISVKDNGIGIDEKHFNRVFKLFQRLHTASEYQGSGIGLSVCRKIVENMGGKIWVESEPGTGSTFFFELPIHHEGMILRS